MTTQPRMDSRSLSPILPGSFTERSQAQVFEVVPQTVVFGDLPANDKVKFMEFLLTNQVEFQLDPSDQMYTATIKIVNNSETPGRKQTEQEIINGLEQMRQLHSYESQALGDVPRYSNSQLNHQRFNSSPGREPSDSAAQLKSQIKDLDKMQARLRQFE